MQFSAVIPHCMVTSLIQPPPR